MPHSARNACVLLAILATAACASSTTQPPLPDAWTDVPADGVPDTVADTGTDTGTDAGTDTASDAVTECTDSDGDGVCDDSDACPGFDDSEDEDGDSVPDGCDICPGGDDTADVDGDGIPDHCDCDGSGIVCDEHATCFNTETGPVCVCNDGWEGDGTTCTDIDECGLGTHTCDVNATCTNTPGSYTCACNSGWTGDGFTCTDIDECATGAHSCHMYATCTNTPGSYTCACNTGYSGDGFTCAPINHCTAGTHTCSPYATCIYTGPGTYSCTCNPGYSGDGFTCTPINHCTAGTHSCSMYATCIYTGPGTYTCACNSGYDGDGFTCTPIDHCARGTDLCSPYATCTYTGPGTYTCTCLPGYTGDGFTCTPSGSTSGCLDGTSEVIWNSEYHACGGPTMSWLSYSEQQHLYCAPGWVMANETIVNAELTGPGYTADVLYAFNGDTCTESQGWYFATRYDSYSQTRSACGWSNSHHWSVGSNPSTGMVNGIVCQRVPASVDLRYTGVSGPSIGSDWILCGRVTSTTQNPRLTSVTRACLVRGLRDWAVARPSGTICETGNQDGWEYPNDNASRTYDYYLTSWTVSGWISPSYSGTNTCGIWSLTTWSSSTAVRTYGTSEAELFIYYHR